MACEKGKAMAALARKMVRFIWNPAVRRAGT
jgi:hypothetical protein